MQEQAPASPPPPAAAPPVPVAAIDPASVYSAFAQQAEVLREQLEGLLDQRSEEIAKLTNMSGNDFAVVRVGVQDRIARLDKRIAGVEEQITAADAQVAAAAAVPGSVPPPIPNQGDDEAGAFFGGTAFGMTLLMVFLFVRRRFWKRKSKAQQSSANLQLPTELAARMERLETVAESTALEVERIGEGQRFVTKLLSETVRQAPNKVDVLRGTTTDI